MGHPVYNLVFFSKVLALASRVVSRDGHRFFVKHGFVQIRNDGQPTWIVSRNEKPLFLKNERKKPQNERFEIVRKKTVFLLNEKNFQKKIKQSLVRKRTKYTIKERSL